eukprot:g12326.t1
MGESCVRPPRRRVAQGDEHGPPGARCDLHSGTTRGTARCFGPHRVRSQPETVKPETAKEQCMAIRHYRGKRGQKKLWRCGKEKCGVCGFTLLHFAAFAGKSKACQTLIDLGVNINAKTQPLCVTPSQLLGERVEGGWKPPRQFCRPTPLDLTIFVANKRAREQESLDKLWLGLIKHQLLLIKDEVVKYNSKIPSALRRVLRTEPRWREIVNFPGERKRLRKAFTAAELWQRLPSQADLQSRLPSEQLMEQQLAKAWQKLHTASIMVEELLLAAPDEIQKLRAMGVQSYAQDAKAAGDGARFDVWQAIEEPEEAVEELEEEEPNAKDEQRRKNHGSKDEPIGNQRVLQTLRVFCQRYCLWPDAPEAE